MLQEILHALNFYLIFSLFGVIGFTVLIYTFKSINFKMYWIAKPIGLVIFGYFIWILSTFKIIKFNNLLLITNLFITTLLICSFLIYRKVKKENIKVNYKSVILKLLAFELICLLLYFGYLYIRAFASNLDSTEKPMDILLLSSAGKTDYFPFSDPWMPSKSVNYYYYGFYLFSLISNLGRVPYVISYNLSLALIFTYTVVLGFIFIYNLTKSKFFSIFGTSLISLAGNMNYVEKFFNNVGTSDFYSKAFYPSATRLYPTSYTINEFPTYSYLLGDLHPHVMGLPFFLTNLILQWHIFKKKKVRWQEIAVLTITMGTSLMINAWDFMTLSLILSFIFLYKIIGIFKRSNSFKTHKDLWKKIGVRVLNISVVGIGALILFSPFIVKFKSPLGGIYFAPTYAKYQREKIQNNPQLNIDDSRGCRLESKNKVSTPDPNEKAEYNCNVFQYPTTLDLLFKYWGILVIPTMIGLLVSANYLKRKERKPIIKVLILFLASITLIAITELIFFGDLFHIVNPPYFRANTVFKFWYHAWILLGICTAVSLYFAYKAILRIKIFNFGDVTKFGFYSIIFILFGSIFIYPFVGVAQAYSPALPWNFITKDQKTNLLDGKELEEITDENLLERLKKPEKRFTLDGSRFLKDKYPDDYLAIQWINKNIKDRLVILEAVGDSYSPQNHARISVYTGMANPVNWKSHEWTWRFHYPEDVDHWIDYENKRNKVLNNGVNINCDNQFDPLLIQYDLDTGYRLPDCISIDVQTIYQTRDITTASNLIKKYNIKYIYIGDLERSTYKDLEENKFKAIADVVYSSGNSRLYKIK